MSAAVSVPGETLPAMTTQAVEASSSVEPLSARDMSILEFEKVRWKHRGARDSAILLLFGLSYIAYIQILWSIVDRSAAEQYDPEHVRRLRRLRDARRADRPSRAIGFQVT